MEEIWRSRWLNRTENVRTAARDADRDLSRRGMSERTRYGVQLAIEELLSNSIKYAFDDENDHHIELSMDMADDFVRLTLMDEGRPFDPSCNPETGICRPVPKPTQGGLGIMMVRRIAESVTYSRAAGKNIVRVDISTAES